MTRRVQNRLKELIAERERQMGTRLTYRYIANAAGLSKNTVGKWARNENKDFDGEVMRKLLDYFDCSVSDLLIYEEVKEPQPS